MASGNATGRHCDRCHRQQWVGLRIIRSIGGRAGDTAGSVEFIAYYRDAAGNRMLHETSRFVHQAGHWLYLDGPLHPTPPRGAPCPCRSGRKFKRCCG